MGYYTDCEDITEALHTVIPRGLYRSHTIHEQDPLNFTKLWVIVRISVVAWVGLGFIHAHYERELQDALGPHIRVSVW